MTRAVYKFSPAKALQAIHYMASLHTDLDLHAALKGCYFADKSHLNQYQQPIFGATYRAMKFGPVPLEIYEIIKGEALWMAELGITEVPWRLEGYRIRATCPAPQRLGEFSDSEFEHLNSGVQKSMGMNFTARTAATHGPDWQKANGGIMWYEDMLDESDDRERIIEFMQDTAHHIRL